MVCLQTLIQEIDTRQAQLDTMQRQGDTMFQNLSASEREKLERRLQDLKEEQKRLKEGAVQKRKELSKSMAEREGLQEDFDKMEAWLTEKERLCGTAQKLPLQTISLAKQLEEKKVSPMCMGTGLQS